MLTKANLAQFDGTQNYYRHWTGVYYTDGIKYLAQEGQAYWLIDAVASYQKDKKILNNQNLRDIQFWTLTIKNGKGLLTCVEDAGMKPVIKQEIPYTDFPLDEVKVWVERGSLFSPQGKLVESMIMMLPSER